MSKSHSEPRVAFGLTLIQGVLSVALAGLVLRFILGLL